MQEKKTGELEKGVVSWNGEVPISGWSAWKNEVMHWKEFDALEKNRVLEEER